jgi:hypothetical protein
MENEIAKSATNFQLYTFPLIMLILGAAISLIAISLQGRLSKRDIRIQYRNEITKRQLEAMSKIVGIINHLQLIAKMDAFDIILEEISSSSEKLAAESIFLPEQTDIFYNKLIDHCNYIIKQHDDIFQNADQKRLNETIDGLRNAIRKYVRGHLSAK